MTILWTFTLVDIIQWGKNLLKSKYLAHRDYVYIH